MNGELPDSARVGRNGFGRPANSWVLALAFVLTISAFLLNVASVKAIFEFFIESDVRRDPTLLLAVLSSPLALLMAITCPLWVWITRRPLTLRRTLIWVLLALLSILGWPLSCFMSNLATMKI